MATRQIQFKRNTQISANAAAAKTSVLGISGQLVNGEIVLNSYYDSNARGGVATLVAIKTNNDKIYFVDNQVILNKLGINDDGTVNPNIEGGIEDVVSGLTDDLALVSGNVETLGDNLDTLSGNVGTIETNLNTVSGDVITLEGKVDTLSGEVVTLASNVDTLSGKTITAVESTDTVTLTKEANTADGTQKIKADVKISEENGNIISGATDGLFASVDYDSATNSIVVNGVSKQLNVGSIVDDIRYDAATHELIIEFTKSDGTSGETSADLSDLIDEYEFPAADENHNVHFVTTTPASGGTIVQADVQSFDCGEY